MGIVEKLLLALLGVIGALFLGQKFKTKSLEKKLAESMGEEKKTEVEKKSAEISLDNFSSLIAELSELKKVKASKPEVGGEKSSSTSVIMEDTIKTVAHAEEENGRTEETVTPSQTVSTELPEHVKHIVKNQASRTKQLRGI